MFQRFKFQFVGHTDAVGSEAYNERLSERRALSVVDYLTSRRGMDRRRLAARGRGESQLLPDVPPDSSENRRVEIRNGGVFQ